MGKKMRKKKQLMKLDFYTVGQKECRTKLKP